MPLRETAMVTCSLKISSMKECSKKICGTVLVFNCLKTETTTMAHGLMTCVRALAACLTKVRLMRATLTKDPSTERVP